MKRNLTLLSLFFALTVFGQHKVIFIKDSLTHEAVSFAAIQFVDKQNGIYADENGQALIPDTVQQVFISQIAYHPKKLDLKWVNHDETVILTPAPNILPEVVITNVSSKRKEIGYLQKKGSNGLIAFPNTNFALFIPYDSTWISQPYITSIISYLEDNLIKSEKYPSARCNIRFDLRLPDANGAPSDASLLEKRVINNSTKIYKGKEIVKLHEPVLFPKEGVFVVIDFITPNNPSPRLLISPTLNVSGAFKTSQTWSRTMTNNFEWIKMDKNDPAWQYTITQFYGQNGIMNLRAGLQIAI
ncbi:MAG: hypothetical protein Q4G63_02235 [Bacteroidia bacterium]|nr:hypothetical protein [Bacteroidia bacterium]